MINFNAFAESDNNITVDQAIEMATEDQSAIEKIDDTIDKLWDNYNAAIDRKKQIEATLDSLESFEELYDKKYEDGETLTAEEALELEGYIKKYGDEPPKYTRQEMLDLYIKPRDFAYKSVYAEIQKLKNTKQTIIPSVELDVRDLYNQVVAFQATLALQESYLVLKTAQHDEMLLKYDLGETTSEELIVSEINLSIQNMQIEKLKNSLDTMEMKFNKLIDAPVTEEFVLVDILSSVEDIFDTEPLHKSLEVYLEEAILNRTEVKNAIIDYDIKEREDSIIKDYLLNELLTDRVNAEIALGQASFNLEQAEATVKDDISDGYISMMTYWNDYLLSVESYKLQMNSYEDTNKRYELGQITSMDLALVDYQVTVAQNTVESNLRNYLNSVEKMDKASGNGPAY